MRLRTSANLAAYCRTTAWKCLTRLEIQLARPSVAAPNHYILELHEGLAVRRRIPPPRLKPRGYFEPPT
jgi:hypothetical protein